jgi:hypothetical protein
MVWILLHDRDLIALLVTVLLVMASTSLEQQLTQDSSVWLVLCFTLARTTLLIQVTQQLLITTWERCLSH